MIHLEKEKLTYGILKGDLKEYEEIIQAWNL